MPSGEVPVMSCIKEVNESEISESNSPNLSPSITISNVKGKPKEQRFNIYARKVNNFL